MAVERANERYIQARVSKSTINPLDVTFTNERIDLRDLIRPLTNEIKGKTFVRCQIVGPINLVLWGNTNMANPDGIACEAVYADNAAPIANAVFMTNCDFRDCEFFNVTFLVQPHQYNHFTSQIACTWITQNPDHYTVFKDGIMHAKEPELELPLQLERPPELANEKAHD